MYSQIQRMQGESFKDYQTRQKADSITRIEAHKQTIKHNRWRKQTIKARAKSDFEGSDFDYSMNG